MEKAKEDPNCNPRTEVEETEECKGFPDNYFYDESLCNCVAKEECPAITADGACPDGQIIDPITKCECLDEKEYKELMAKIAALGPDCLAGTPDDDEDDVGQDDCPQDYSWDSNICSCVTKTELNPDCDSDLDYLCVWDSVSFDQDTCECITEPDYKNRVEENDLGPDCKAGTDDDPVPEEPLEQGECPDGFEWDSNICWCVKEDKEICPMPDFFICVWDLKLPASCEDNCLTEAEYKARMDKNDLDP